MTGQETNRFDGWYMQMAEDEVRDRLVADCLRLPRSMRVSGLLAGDGLAEVISLVGLGRGQVLVDLACGRGGYGREIARSCRCELIGIDASSVAISQARADLRTDTLATATFEVADFEATGLPDQVADAVVCIDSYQFASSQETLFGEAARITRPGGRLVLTGAMRRAALQANSTSPVEQALTSVGWTDVRVHARPEWSEVEERLWKAAIAETTSTPAITALKAEAAEMLQAMPHIRRFVATAVRE